MAKKPDEFNRAIWTRTVVLKRPDITLEQLQAEYDKSGDRPKKDRPKNQMVISQARTQLCKRWGLKTLEDLPLDREGNLNLSSMCRLYFDKFGFEDTAQIGEPYFEEDGLVLKDNQFASIKSTYKKSKGKGKTVSQGSPDENQDSGPRAGHETKKVVKRRGPNKKKQGRRSNQEVNDEDRQKKELTVDVYESCESQIAKLILVATEMKNSKLASDLRQAQRRASAAILQHQD